jgi:hypothetical protein
MAEYVQDGCRASSFSADPLNLTFAVPATFEAAPGHWLPRHEASLPRLPAGRETPPMRQGGARIARQPYRMCLCCGTALRENPAPMATSKSPASVRPSIWEIYFPKRFDGRQEAVYVASFPEIILFWPTILALFGCALLQATTNIEPGWIAVVIVSLNALVLVQNFDQKKFLIFVLLVLAFGLGVWIVNLYGFTFLKRLAGWILSFDPRFSSDAYLLLGTILTVYFFWGLLAPLFSYWKLEQNEFIHYTPPVGRDMSIARSGCTVYKDIPDILEYVLGAGAGTLLIKRGNEVLATIPRVPFLGFRMNAIEEMLSETRVTVDKE